ncbi:putative tRNA threonylcarbamoyladenosine biosynthesis protein Gcp [uncultured delta proteobacterium]|uniref:tRNA N6-adenosine threonylcarbamoyltransferase n=1 Tax=uncultured delta proteobacterium TaxID=34034 RepID=A0A212J3W6_9DELT|nr:putative tRNA threonylcarbamoyladenosine biosynthesis protein Gcp [uncultured delta proteobacterium]
MLCLGIETSCDETALALVDDGRVAASVMSSQADLHALFGGVVPELASREHGRLIGPLFDLLLQKAAIPSQAIDTVAFARGPGLLGSLLVGAAFAKGLAVGLARPVIGVNHLHAHLLAAGIDNELRFPALGLLVSGGHTHIYRIRSPRDFVPLGRTIDDAAGEAFDKVGKLLGLPYPAGRLIDDMARRGTPVPGLLRCPYMDNDNLDFSFSGLKTAAATIIKNTPGLVCKPGEEPGGDTLDFCASLQEAIALTLQRKFARALDREPGIRSLVVAGGVAANSAVRQAMTRLAEEHGLPVAIPSPLLCTDNGSMVAYAGWLLAREGGRHDLRVSCIPRGIPIPDDVMYPE